MVFYMMFSYALVVVLQLRPDPTPDPSPHTVPGPVPDLTHLALAGRTCST